MGKRRSHSKVNQLSPRLIEAINVAIAQDGVTYDHLADMVDDWVAQGAITQADAPSRSGLARHGKSFLARMEQLNRMREQAKTIVAEAGGDGTVLEEAATNLVLNEIMAIFMAADPEQGMKTVDVARIAQGLGRLQSSSVQRERLKVDMVKRAQAAAKKVAATARKAGLSAAAIATIERDVLGIAR